MKFIFFANTDWYLFNFRLPFADELRKAGHEVVMISPPGSYSERLEAAGYRWLPINMNRRSINPVSEVFVISRLIKLFRSEAPDVVHNFTIKSSVYGTIASRYCGIKAIVNAIDGLGYVFSSDQLLARLLRGITARLLKATNSGNKTRMVLQNGADYDFLLKNAIVEPECARLLVGGVGVDTELFQPAARDASEKPTVTFASRLLKEKGIIEFVEVARRLKKKGTRVRFVIAGTPDTGNPGSVTENMLAEWRTWNCADFVGHSEDMPGLLAASDITVLATAYGEGAPRILMEAAACQVALIGSDNAGCKEVVIDGVNGLLIPPRDADALETAIETLLGDPMRRQTMGEAGRKLVVEKFNDKIIARKMLSIYREIIPSV